MKCTSCALVCALSLVCSVAVAQSQSSSKLHKVVVQAPYLFNRATRYAHSMPEVPGPEITVTKKTTVVQLADQPPVIDICRATAGLLWRRSMMKS